jgi:hypothetical protein
VCLTSALAYHELTDVIPRSVWIAIGTKDRRPKVEQPRLSVVRFGPKVLSAGIEEHEIEGVTVRIFNPAKTAVDLFRCRRRAGNLYQQKSRPESGSRRHAGSAPATQGGAFRNRALRRRSRSLERFAPVS